jgi:hypothetical protein
MFTVNRHPSSADLRSFGRAMLLGFASLGGAVWIVSWWRGAFPSLLDWTGTSAQLAAVGLWAAGVLLYATSHWAPTSIAKPVYVGWMSAATTVGMIMTTVLLTILFVVMLPVFSLVVRASDPLRKRFKSGGTYWEDYRSHEPTLERMRRPF